jgi:hypothetical protein
MAASTCYCRGACPVILTVSFSVASVSLILSSYILVVRSIEHHPYLFPLLARSSFIDLMKIINVVLLLASCITLE